MTYVHRFYYYVVDKMPPRKVEVYAAGGIPDKALSDDDAVTWLMDDDGTTYLTDD